MTDLEKLLKLIKERPVSTEIRLYEKGLFEGDTQGSIKILSLWYRTI